MSTNISSDDEYASITYVRTSCGKRINKSICYDNTSLKFISDFNTTLSKRFVYEEYFRNSATKEYIVYSLKKLITYEEKFSISDSTFELNTYSDEFLEKLFEDVYNT